jgi:hypothetical protein
MTLLPSPPYDLQIPIPFTQSPDSLALLNFPFSHIIHPTCRLRYPTPRTVSSFFPAPRLSITPLRFSDQLRHFFTLKPVNPSEKNLKVLELRHFVITHGRCPCPLFKRCCKMGRSHEYHIHQKDDDGFPRHLCQDIKTTQLQTILDTSNRETIELAAKLDIHLHVVASPTVFDRRLL